MTYDVADFQKQVLDRSFSIPVLVDFWAQWCGPCRTLGPTLERMGAAANGRWELAKINTEDLPEVAAQYGVRSIPNVKLFVDGKVADEFVGALPESQIEQWLARVIPSKLRLLVDQAEALIVGGAADQARGLLAQVREQEPTNDRANAMFVRLLAFDEPAQAARIAETIVGVEYGETVEAIRTVAHLSEFVNAPSVEPLPLAHRLYIEAIEDLFAHRNAAALEKFIETIRQDRRLDDDGARRACIAVFKLLGEDHPITLEYRREFSNALY